MTEEVVDTSKGLAILQALSQAGKISEAQYVVSAELVLRMKECKENLSKLNENVALTIEQEKMLYKKISSINQEMVKQNLELAKVTEEQKENETVLTQLTENIEKKQKDMEELKSRKSYFEYELQDLTNKKALLHEDLDERQKKERDRILPELERLEELIRQLNEDIARVNGETGNKQKRIEALEKIKAEVEAKSERIKEEHEKLQEEYIAAQQKPLNGDENGMKIVDDELNKLRSQNEALLARITETSKEYADLQIAGAKAESDKRESNTRIDTLNREYNAEKQAISRLREETREDMQKQEEIENLTKIEDNAKKSMVDSTTKKKKLIEVARRELDKVEKELMEIEDQIKQRQTEVNTTTKKVDEKKVELERLKKVGAELEDEIKLFTAKTANKDAAILSLKDKVDALRKEESQFEVDLAKYKKEETCRHEDIKKLTIMKEKMARTASQANQQAKERKEELKILRLSILDLSKKHQETKLRLDNSVSKYEGVKSERNKYVTMIQNCSQALAENKEKIKILQNEVEILRNELLEKEQSLRDLEHKLKREKFEHDRQAKEIRMLTDTFTEKQARTTQQSKEIINLELILYGINRDIKNFTSKYEDACESRNYMGIQLIDRNDELCILYEKSNVQESVLKRGENEIKLREEEARMLSIELAEKQRELELIQKKAPEVPVLSVKVVSLKTELEQVRCDVKALSENVENPEANPGRIREIDTYVPDQEFLDAKIHVLEERLNAKKESLLEKELVLEEIANLAEKLRKQALEGRKGTLELAEKINDFRARTTELSRKMLATVAEVSMFQATAMKLEQEKQSKEKVLDDARDRVSKALPPTPESEDEWQRLERQSRVAAELRESLLRKSEANKTQEQLGVKTTAKPRNTLYPSDVTGLYECYGGVAPFLPSKQGANMRHIRKPVPKDIEIQ